MHFLTKCVVVVLYELKVQIWVLSHFELVLEKFPSESKTNNTDQSALLTNKKWPFQIPWARLWEIQVLLGRGARRERGAGSRGLGGRKPDP